MGNESNIKLIDPAGSGACNYASREAEARHAGCGMTEKSSQDVANFRFQSTKALSLSHADAGAGAGQPSSSNFACKICKLSAGMSILLASLIRIRFLFHPYTDLRQESNSISESHLVSMT